MDKVLGALPDYAEYLGLCRLNQMCVDVKKVYNFGAEVTIAADGVVFNGMKSKRPSPQIPAAYLHQI
jgi:pyoverdine/dityrosine biosynthesis protein Dit1